jgi:prepilin-type N-terminal cleavage/methylation domain-containing protein
VRCRLTRRGFTLVELLLVLVVGGIVGAALSGVLRRQERFYTGVGSLVAQRVSLRDATGIIPGELRALSAMAGDVLAFSDSSLEIRATVGAGIACDTVAGGGAIVLASGQASSRDMVGVVSAFTTTPAGGDIALVYDAGPSDGAADDGWASVEVADLASAAGQCDASPFAAGASGSLRLRFVAGTTLPPTVRPGAFVRVLRRVRYRLYRAATGDWFLGFAAWDGGAFGIVQPVSGPFAPYARGARGGLSLRYFDASDAEVTPGMDATRIARVEVTARGVPDEGLSRQGSASDSQTVTIRLRNR